MKNTLQAFTVLLLFFGYNNLFAQNRHADSAAMVSYTPFNLAHSQWEDCCDCAFTQCINVCAGAESDFSYYWTTGDTAVIDTLTYYKLFTNWQWFHYNCDGGIPGGSCGLGPLVASGGATNDSIGALCGYLRQDTIAKKIFFLKVDSVHETLLYNFNISVGDTVAPQTVVGSIDSVYTSGMTRRRINFLPPDSNWFFGHIWWIEGVGSSAGLFNQYYPNGYGGMCCFSTNNSCPYRNLPVGIIEIQPAPAISLFPNPVNDICTLLLTGTGIYSASVADITGRELLSLFANRQLSEYTFSTISLSSGLYFVRVTDATYKCSVAKLVKE